MKIAEFAWVTLATNDSYSLGALVLANSLKRAGTGHQLAVLITPGVSNAMRCVSNRIILSYLPHLHGVLVYFKFCVVLGSDSKACSMWSRR